MLTEIAEKGVSINFISKKSKNGKKISFRTLCIFDITL